MKKTLFLLSLAALLGASNLKSQTSKLSGDITFGMGTTLTKSPQVLIIS